MTEEERKTKISLVGKIISHLSKNTHSSKKKSSMYWYGDKFDFYYDMKLNKIKRYFKTITDK